MAGTAAEDDEEEEEEEQLPFYVILDAAWPQATLGGWVTLDGLERIDSAMCTSS